jgi:hypothetical protein
MRDEGVEILLRKAIEEEVGHDEVVGLGRFERESIGLEDAQALIGVRDGCLAALA